ncbi:MAG: ATP-dependent zinc metalloprotease FtsH [Bacteroidetes bacterium]|nr:ATP-dependent zinc metalloprotease FtsH [Bacteroidota bacterium]
MNDQDKKGSENNRKLPGGFSPKSFMWLYVLLGGFLIWQYFISFSSKPEEITWTRFKHEMLAENDVQKITVVNKEVAEVFIKEDRLSMPRHEKAKNRDVGPHYSFQIGSIEAFEKSLEDAQEGMDRDEMIEVQYISRTNWMRDIASWVLPFAIIIGIWILLLRRMNPGGRGLGGRNPFDFGKSNAKLFDKENKSKVNFKDVAGLEEAKVEIKEIVDFLMNPEAYTRLGAKIPKGVLLVGPPGTGKTLLAKAVAGEAQTPFYSMSGSEFVEMFVGVGASRVRDLFKKAKTKAPSIIFIDEIDAIGRSRGKAFSMQSNDERESTLNQLLTEMDGFGANTGVIVLAATNRADVLDRALLRPGRFDRHIYLELPNMTERKAIFEVHMRPLKLGKDINLETLAAQTPGFSGADIANICNESALIAARKKKNIIEMDDFTDATDRVVAGLEKKSKIISPKEKKIIAHHEAGHAVVSWFLEHTDTLMKVSIVPRGKSLGAAWYLPQEHQIHTKPQFLDRICAALGGRAAEEIIFGEVSSGALDDLEKVTKQAYTMVAYYGLDDKLGNISYYDSTGQYEQSIQKPYSEATAEIIDEEVRKLVSTAYERTKKVLNEHREQLEGLARLLLEKEVVFKADIEGVFGKRGIEK